MEGKKDEFVGKVKETAGDISGDDELEAKGTGQKYAGKVEQVGEKVEDKAEEAGDALKR
jgi:uncharacterized protein YjbJ (UPF0337 family)